jgi:hypothetical protein
MQEYIKATALSLILVFSAATASSAQVAVGPTQPAYNGVVGRYAEQQFYENAPSSQCNDGLNGAVNGGRAPSLRYPVPGSGCTSW